MLQLDSNQEINGGINVEMFKIMAERLQFDAEITLSSHWYKFDPNGTIGASMGDVCYYFVVVVVVVVVAAAAAATAVVVVFAAAVFVAVVVAVVVAILIDSDTVPLLLVILAAAVVAGAAAAVAIVANVQLWNQVILAFLIDVLLFPGTKWQGRYKLGTVDIHCHRIWRLEHQHLL